MLRRLITTLVLEQIIGEIVDAQLAAVFKFVGDFTSLEFTALSIPPREITTPLSDVVLVATLNLLSLVQDRVVIAAVGGVELLLATLGPVVTGVLRMVDAAGLVVIVGLAAPGVLVIRVSLFARTHSLLVTPALVSTAGLHVLVVGTVHGQTVTAPHVLERSLAAHWLRAVVLFPLGVFRTARRLELLEGCRVHGLELALVGLDVLQEIGTAHFVGGAVVTAEVQSVGRVALGLDLVTTVVHGGTLLGGHVVALSLGTGQ